MYEHYPHMHEPIYMCNTPNIYIYMLEIEVPTHSLLSIRDTCPYSTDIILYLCIRQQSAEENTKKKREKKQSYTYLPIYRFKYKSVSRCAIAHANWWYW